MSDDKPQTTLFCCIFHLTGGSQSELCADLDVGKIIIGTPLGPPDDEIDEEEGD